MLRCVVYPEGRQQILASPPKYEIRIDDLRRLDGAAASARLDATRARLSHKVHASDQWPLFDFCVSRLNEKISRLHIGIDLLIVDGRSFEILFQELIQLYHHPGIVVPRLPARADFPGRNRRVSGVARVLDEARPHAAGLA
jgi:hypothetical protein